MTHPRIVPSNTVVKWAVHASAHGSIAYIDGMTAHWPKTLPHVGDTLTVPFLVDPVTRQPVQVMVLELVEFLHHRPPAIAVVVGRPH